MNRRSFLKAGLGAAVVPWYLTRSALTARAASTAHRVIFFYYPDGVHRASWRPSGSGASLSLSHQLAPLERHKDRCVFLSGLGSGPTDSGSHPGGAKKLLTAKDGGRGESLDHGLARTVYSGAPHRHLYLGVQANQNGASGDKHISYVGSEQTIAPEDDPRLAFSRLFTGATPRDPAAPSSDVTVIDAMRADLEAFSADLGAVEQRKLSLHLESLREVEERVRNTTAMPPTCDDPAIVVGSVTDLYAPERFGDLLNLQIDVMVEAMACNLTHVGVLQCSHHTSELIMSRIPNAEMTNTRDTRSHEASHYGGSGMLLDTYVAQRRWFADRLAHLMDRLAMHPEGDGTMLDHTLVLFCTEVSDGDDHSHHDLPFVLAGGASGAIDTGRFVDVGDRRHGDLLATVARAAGAPFDGWGDGSQGPLTQLLRV